MASRFLSAVTDPFISYFQATIGATCESFAPKAKAPLSKKQRKKAARYKRRERKQSFSLMRCVQKQREMTSPNSRRDVISVESVREHYLRESWNSHDSSPVVH